MPTWQQWGRWRRRMAAIGLCTLLCSNCGIPWSKQRIVRVISLGLKAASEASQFQVQLRGFVAHLACCRTLNVGHAEAQGHVRCLLIQVGKAHHVLCGEQADWGLSQQLLNFRQEMAMW